MNQREKKLAIFFGTVILYWWGKPIFERTFVEPIDLKKTEVQTLLDSVDTLEIRDMRLLAAQTRVVNATRMALPPEELVAQRLYQEWVTELANMYQLQDLEVKPEGRSSRGKVYTSVRVGLTAQASYEQICRFLSAFENAAILHRVSQLHLECDEHRGNPLVEISLSAEALALPDSPMRETIFPRFRLNQAVSESAVSFSPKETKGFPKEQAFLVRIGNELIQILPETPNQWTLKRGYEGTTAVSHEPGEEVELFSLRTDRPLISEQEMKRIIAENFFVKPTPPVDYEPRWETVGNQVALRGRPFKLQLKADGFSPVTPPRMYSIEGKIPTGLTLDERTGEIQWEPETTAEMREYPLKLAVHVEGESEPRFKEDVLLTVRDPNLPPEISEVESQVVLPGAEYKLKLEAIDIETAPEELKFSVQGELPVGASFNGESGILTWTPPVVALPEEIEISFTVTDKGEPAESSNRKIKFNIIEDFTRDTVLTGIVKPDDDMKAMFYNRAENISTTLREGDDFELSGVKGMVMMIGRDFVLWQSGDALWQLKLGQTLSDRSQAQIPGAE
ncbi:MAG: Ig domain-containing protein [Planctomycetaceae bacterium]|nr:Ig domain-containing protein [Planctomycetaceae bacterium]MDG2388174.1 Ig domain-containing protein [Planctomycetaceae bacterium]